MKKLMLIMTVALFAASCEGIEGPPGPRGPQGHPGENGEVRKLVVDDIIIRPNDWQVATAHDDMFDYFYADIQVPEFTWDMLNEGLYYSYMKYLDGNILVEEGLGVSIHLEWYNETDEVWYPYTETVGCSYSEGEIRYMLSRSDFYDGRPEGDYVFRFVVLY